MNKLTIKIITVGYLPADFDKEKITKKKSKLFEISNSIESYSLNSDSDLDDWGYSDQLLANEVPAKGDENLLIVLTSVPLEDNYYTRRLNNNIVIFTFHEIAEYLRLENIPVNNVVMRLIYAYSLVYLRNNKRIPMSNEITNFTHDETRGCLFDMNGLKNDIVHSCHYPEVCSNCTQRLSDEKVSLQAINRAKEEIKSIVKPKYYRIASWVKLNPVWAILISSTWAVMLGVSGSLLASLLSG